MPSGFFLTRARPCRAGPSSTSPCRARGSRGSSRSRRATSRGVMRAVGERRSRRAGGGARAAPRSAPGGSAAGRRSCTRLSWFCGCGRRNAIQPAVAGSRRRIMSHFSNFSNASAVCCRSSGDPVFCAASRSRSAQAKRATASSSSASGTAAAASIARTSASSAASKRMSPRFRARRLTTASFMRKIGAIRSASSTRRWRSASTPKRRATNAPTCGAVSTRIAEIASGFMPAPRLRRYSPKRVEVSGARSASSARKRPCSSASFSGRKRSVQENPGRPSSSVMGAAESMVRGDRSVWREPAQGLLAGELHLTTAIFVALGDA